MNKIKKSHFFILLGLSVLFFVLVLIFPGFFSSGMSYDSNKILEDLKNLIMPKPEIPVLDIITYDKKLQEIANNPPPPLPITKIVKDPTTGEETIVTIPAKETPPNLWPVKTVYPNAGAILPFKRIIAYYGNLYSKGMGVLGQYPPDEMLEKLNTEVVKWNIADEATLAVPALHYIAVTAQLSSGGDGKHRLRMPSSEIDKVLAIAKKINALVFLDIQVGFSTVEIELPLLERYLKMPEVHLGLDPEFSMKNGIRPGKAVGTFDAVDINFVTNYLANLVKENNLPPKVLVIHRYTQKMVTNYELIKTLPEVQIVMHMDGWGGKAHKISTYKQFIYQEPVQFTGFKLFYKNDVFTEGSTLMTPNELLKLRPQPVYIQYQ